VFGQQAAQKKCIGIDVSSCLGSTPPIKVQKYMDMHFSWQLAAQKQGISIYFSTCLGGMLPRTIEKAMMMYLWLRHATYRSTSTSAYILRMSDYPRGEWCEKWPKKARGLHGK
jgi:hypothetical protein